MGRVVDNVDQHAPGARRRVDPQVERAVVGRGDRQQRPVQVLLAERPRVAARAGQRTDRRQNPRRDDAQRGPRRRQHPRLLQRDPAPADNHDVRALKLDVDRQVGHRQIT
ncbi:MAG: hypothetical protein BWZ08_02698 [candidate division BRC1 bacterium ADurb.BinA292]|nr:MAG: hypothetical protein BWZ08_02698 [candidate division BRC1 bacterium ADurb.BinA292]